MSNLRSRLTFANIVALIALFFALGGPSLAADAVQSATKRITGKQVTNGSLSEKDLSKKARAKLRGQRGATGAQGPNGPAGPKGANGSNGSNGSPDTPQQLLAKVATVDGAGSALDADLIDGLDSAALQQRTSTPACPVNQFLRALAASGSPTCSSVFAPDIDTDAVGSSEIDADAVQSSEINDGSIREQDVGTLTNGLRGNNIGVVSFQRANVPIPSIPAGACLAVNDDNGVGGTVPATVGDFVIPSRPVGFPDALSLEPTVTDTASKAVFEVCNRTAGAIDPADTFDIGILAIRPG